MKDVKVCELQGLALDYAVAEAIGWKEPIHRIGDLSYFAEERHGVKEQHLMMEAPDPDEPDEVTEQHHFDHLETWSPSRLWSQCGPLIDRYQAYPNRYFGRCPGSDENKRYFVMTYCMNPSYGKEFGSIEGPTALIAACRAIVAAKLGDVVSIPDELVLPD